MKLACVLLAACWTGPVAEPAAPPAPPKRGPISEARIVTMDDRGGVIELRGDREQAMQHANGVMARGCGEGNYTIVQEGEEAVGNKNGKIETAWRVHFQCNGAQ